MQGAVRDANPSAGSAPVENHDLPEKKQEACQRLAKASMKRRVEADEDGYLLPSEVPPKKKDESTGKKWRKTIRNGKNKHPRLLFMMKWSPSKWTFLVSKGASLDLCFGFRHPQSMKNKAFNLGAHCIQLDLENAQVFVVDAEDPQPKCLLLMLKILNP